VGETEAQAAAPASRARAGSSETKRALVRVMWDVDSLPPPAGKVLFAVAKRLGALGKQVGREASPLAQAEASLRMQVFLDPAKKTLGPKQRWQFIQTGTFLVFCNDRSADVGLLDELNLKTMDHQGGELLVLLVSNANYSDRIRELSERGVKAVLVRNPQIMTEEEAQRAAARDAACAWKVMDWNDDVLAGCLENPGLALGASGKGDEEAAPAAACAAATATATAAAAAGVAGGEPLTREQWTAHTKNVCADVLASPEGTYHAHVLRCAEVVSLKAESAPSTYTPDKFANFCRVTCGLKKHHSLADHECCAASSVLFAKLHAQSRAGAGAVSCAIEQDLSAATAAATAKAARASATSSTPLSQLCLEDPPEFLSALSSDMWAGHVHGIVKTLLKNTSELHPDVVELINIMRPKLRVVPRTLNNVVLFAGQTCSARTRMGAGYGLAARAFFAALCGRRGDAVAAANSILPPYVPSPAVLAPPAALGLAPGPLSFAAAVAVGSAAAPAAAPVPTALSASPFAAAVFASLPPAAQVTVPLPLPLPALHAAMPLRWAVHAPSQMLAVSPALAPPPGFNSIAARGPHLAQPLATPLHLLLQQQLSQETTNKHVQNVCAELATRHGLDSDTQRVAVLILPLASMCPSSLPAFELYVAHTCGAAWEMDELRWTMAARRIFEALLAKNAPAPVLQPGATDMFHSSDLFSRVSPWASSYAVIPRALHADIK
jgi:hypothetical protein